MGTWELRDVLARGGTSDWDPGMFWNIRESLNQCAQLFVAVRLDIVARLSTSTKSPSTV